MKKILGPIWILVVCQFFVAGTVLAGITEGDVMDLVNQTSSGIAADAGGVLKKIVNAEHPYQNKDNKALYVFVYDTDVKIVAHPKKTLVGKSYKGKPDVRGKKFRDEIVEGALKNKTGWVTYAYTKPGETGIHHKKTYYMRGTGSDGKTYIVCSGMYAD